MLLREVVGAELRAARVAQGRTLREVCAAANVALGYLSELERGRKEASSELLASICDELGLSLTNLLFRAAQSSSKRSEVQAATETLAA